MSFVTCCSGALRPALPVRPLCRHPGVGGGVGPAAHGRAVGLAAHPHHRRGRGVLVHLRAAPLVPLPVPHRRHERPFRKTEHDGGPRTAGRVLRWVVVEMGCYGFPAFPQSQGPRMAGLGCIPSSPYALARRKGFRLYDAFLLLNSFQASALPITATRAAAQSPRTAWSPPAARCTATPRS